MKRIIVTTSLAIVLAVTAFTQPSAFAAKATCCHACCQDKCGQTCCQTGCTVSCCQGK